jgi:ribosomal protein S18 acetylase RimI-like enzyme
VDVVSLGYRSDLMLRVLGGSEVTHRDSYVVVRTPGNPTFWWGNFILLGSPPRPGEAGLWLSRFSAEFPGAGHVALGIDVTDASQVEPAEFIDAGLDFERATVMTARAVHEPPRPNRLAHYRQLDGDDDWQQSAELEVASSASPDIAHRAFIGRRTSEARGITEAGHGAWFGAFLAGRLVSQLGLVRAGVGLARFQNVGTHPAMRGHGLAGTLVYRAGQYGFGALGARMLVIVADPGYVAARIYRSVGFADTESQVSFERAPTRPRTGRWFG